MRKEKSNNFIGRPISFSIFATLFVMMFFAGAATAEKTLVVGCTLPLERAMGLETKKSTEVIIDDFNKSGGLTIKGEKYKIKLVVYDDKYRPDGGRAAVERLIHQDKAAILINQIGSPPTVAGLTVTEPAKTMVWAGPASSKFLKGKKYTFRVHHYLLKDIGALNMLKEKHPNIKKIVTLARDNLSGKAMTKVATNCGDIIGWKVLKNIYHQPDESNFSSVATKIVSMKPDLVIHAANVAGTQYGLILKALHTAGYDGIQYGSLAPKMDEVLAASSPEAVEGLYCEFPDPTTLPTPTPEAEKLRKLYEAKYGGWSPTAAKWVGPWYGWLAAVKKADSLDVEKIQAVLPGLVVETPMGKAALIKRPDIEVDRYGDIVRDWYAGQVKDGKVVYLTRVSYSTFIEYAEKKYGKTFR